MKYKYRDSRNPRNLPGMPEGMEGELGSDPLARILIAPPQLQRARSHDLVRILAQSLAGRAIECEDVAHVSSMAAGALVVVISAHIARATGKKCNCAGSKPLHRHSSGFIPVQDLQGVRYSLPLRRRRSWHSRAKP